MNKKFEEIVEKLFNASSIKELEVVQSLWSGYGKLSRLELIGSQTKTVIAKNIILPIQANHPRGWNTNNSHQRKVKSYKVESYWYTNYANNSNEDCRIAKHYYSAEENNELLILLEDLDASGFPIRKSSLNKNEIKICLKWLANFHAIFMNTKPTNLWEVGTYWNLATRPDELEVMKNIELKEAAHLIDEKLNSCKFQTFVHGDAKVANFCFSKDLKYVAVVDFQYVGGGCGIKDVIYLMGSCLSDDECEKHESELLDFYFKELKQALLKNNSSINFSELEKEWRYLYPIAWTDFTRFLLGWMPTHQKLNRYSYQLLTKTLELI
ncbi:DUF1679 domain-containing protein [Vicingus serpentipes]|uniref:DUF1679 domain-containing protein n=1 Tax=Vicingus serpentipes TaxID=1926625 RepID=A0A5C6RTQ2_9FLAO|nr:oxidoreductase family protein [Vicingus serpentipes]TXB65856.1 DUF1679 domain-containing protein [Vicingus serpentipes]